MKLVVARSAVVAVASALVGLTGPAALAASGGPPEMRITPAEHVPGAGSAMILSATLVAERVVAVGDHGVVLLSDDGGHSYRQARSVPVSSTLTSVAFVDASHGWAVGHWGVVLRTEDGGETWTLQRSELSVDQPLFSVYFKDEHQGWAVGLWSLMLHTVDGGAHWSKVTLPAPAGSKTADRNLYRIFGNAMGELFIACEQGRVMRSTDNGASWRYLETGYNGSFWTGVALSDGVVLVGGLRGTIYRSSDGGATWTASNDTFNSSITDMIQLADSTVVAVALDGVSLISHDDGESFSGTQRPDRAPLTAVSPSPAGTAVLFSANGPIG